jgi:hypothetical protein
MGRSSMRSTSRNLFHRFSSSSRSILHEGIVLPTLIYLEKFFQYPWCRLLDY